MNFQVIYFLLVTTLALLVHANPNSAIKEGDLVSTKALFGIIDSSIIFSAKAEAIMPRIKEWFFYTPYQSGFSAIINASSVFATLAEYVVESEQGFIPRLSFVHSSKENETTVEFEPRRERGTKRARYQGIEVKLTLLFRASEHGFLMSEFHSLCDGKGATVTLVKARNGRMAAAYNGIGWGHQPLSTPNPQGVLASIVDDPGAIGGYSLQKYDANENAVVYRTGSRTGPNFGWGLLISDRCNENERSFSHLMPIHGYGSEGVEPLSLFGVERFGVLEYEVFHVELAIV
jgi:hypothetical protein